MENVLPRSLDLFTNSISVTAFKESTQNAWLWVTLCMIGIYFFDGDGRVWLVGFLQGEKKEEEGLNGEGEDTIDSDFSLGIRSQSFATGPPKVERSQVHWTCFWLDVN